MCVQWEKIGTEENVMARINQHDSMAAVFLPGDYSSIHDTKYVPNKKEFDTTIEKYNLLYHNCNTFIIDLIRDSGNEEVINRIGYDIIPDQTYNRLSEYYKKINSK